MAYRSPAEAGMESPARWLAVLRIIVGLYFAKAVFTKLQLVLLGGLIPVPMVEERWISVMPKIVAKQAAGNPLLFFKDFLEGIVIPNSQLFANLTAWGEVVVGIGLTFGLLNGMASLIGTFMAVNYGLATQWMSPGQQGFHIVLVALMVAFFFARAGKVLGLDGVIARRRPKSTLARRPFS